MSDSYSRRQGASLDNTRLLERTRKVSQLVTIKAAAKRLSLSESKVYRMTMEGELDAVHIGRAVRIPSNALDEIINRYRPELPDYLKGETID